MSKKIEHNKTKDSKEKPTLIYNDATRADEREIALKALEKMKALEKRLMKRNGLTKVKIPLGNGVAYTTRPKEFERIIRENDFFRV